VLKRTVTSTTASTTSDGGDAEPFADFCWDSSNSRRTTTKK